MARYLSGLSQLLISLLCCLLLAACGSSDKSKSEGDSASDLTSQPDRDRVEAEDGTPTPDLSSPDSGPDLSGADKANPEDTTGKDSGGEEVIGPDTVVSDMGADSTEPTDALDSGADLQDQTPQADLAGDQNDGLTLDLVPQDDQGSDPDLCSGNNCGTNCKTSRLDNQTAKLIHEGDSQIVSPSDYPATTPRAILPALDCRGGKIDIVIVPEGYKQADMTRFEQDAELWLAELKKLSPFKEYLGAFNVWIVKLPSEDYLKVQSNADSKTRFHMALTDSGSGIKLPGTTSAQWGQMEAAFFDALKYVPYNRTHKYPNDGKNSANHLKQVVGVILAYKSTCSTKNDPSKACDGYSGWTRTFKDPGDGTVRARIAIARNRMHELGHALAYLTDEYRSDSTKTCTAASLLNGYNASNWTIRTINNYAYSNHSIHLPWQHLLLGGNINKIYGIIGAHEGAYYCWSGAFRPEYRCLMNGKHGNSDACTADLLQLRQTNFCNWCHELVTMRIFEKIGWLNKSDPLKEWIDNYRTGFWQKNGIKQPDKGLPVKDSCSDPIYEDTLAGFPCEGHTNGECKDSAYPYCGWSTSAGISYCTKECSDNSDCLDLFPNGCCAQGNVRKMCRPAADPRCI